MKHKLILILAILLLVGAVIAERTTRYFARNLKKESLIKQSKLDDVVALTQQREVAEAKCDALTKLGKELKSALSWEHASSTQVNSWFSKVATDLGAKVELSGKLNPRRCGQESDTIMGGTLERSQYDVRIRGDYHALVQYVERVEQSPMVMLIKHLNIRTTPDAVGVGTLNMTIMCLTQADVIPAVAPTLGNTSAPGAGAHGKGGAS